MAALSPPKRVTLSFVHRKTGAVHKEKTFEFRNEFRAWVKMWAWVFSHDDEFKPSEYRLVATIHEGPYPQFVARKLKESRIQVIEPNGRGIEVYG